eukprot:TRINITY_DN125_c0_g1_i1.p1 TRINITY_DN125_c0_g1~~TRINITY_DN125_c0_g1_i1.p1  ORF type:complete len:296 (-),score=44.07 TRINITY_DN125_c0_g1_i1:453-1340(-)
MQQVSEGANNIKLERMIKLSDGGIMPRVGFGTYKAAGEQCYKAVLTALNLGIRHIDTANAYRNEDHVGRAIRDSGIPREQIFLSSKVGPKNQGWDAAMKACQDSLKQLQMDYIDLMMIHWPGASGINPEGQQNRNLRMETWRMLEEFHNRGNIKHLGVSNYEISHLKDLLKFATVPPVVNQIEVHPRFHNTQVRQFCKENNIQVVAYASLGCGELLRHEVVEQVSNLSDRSPAQVLLRWGLQKGCAVIPKSVNEYRIAQFVEEELLDWELTSDQEQMLDKLDDDYKYCWNPSTIT